MYECHLTYENVTPEAEKRMRFFADVAGWKTSYITDDPTLGPGKRFFLTAHDNDLGVLYAKMKDAAYSDYLPLPVREKIEHIVHDSKFKLDARAL